MQHSVFDLGAFCSVRYAKDAGSRGDAQTRGGHQSAIHYSFAFSSACLTCLVKQSVPTVVGQEQAKAEEVLWRLMVLGYHL